MQGNEDYDLPTEYIPLVKNKENVKEIHNRQPVILNQSDVKQYLNIELQGSYFLIERKVPDLNYYEISKDVNKPANNSASLVQPVLK